MPDEPIPYQPSTPQAPETLHLDTCYVAAAHPNGTPEIFMVIRRRGDDRLDSPDALWIQGIEIRRLRNWLNHLCEFQQVTDSRLIMESRYQVGARGLSRLYSEAKGQVDALSEQLAAQLADHQEELRDCRREMNEAVADALAEGRAEGREG